MRAVGIRPALLGAFLVACGLPLVVFWFWPYGSALQREVAQAQARHELTAATVAETLALWREDVLTIFDSLASRISGRPGDVGFAEEALVKQGFLHICVFDAESGRLLDSALTRQEPCPALAAGERFAMFQEMTRQPGARMSDVHADDGRPKLFLARRVNDRLVVGAIGTAFVRRIAERARFGDSGHVVVFDGAGQLLAHPRPDWVETARRLTMLPVVQAMMRGERGVTSFLSPALGEEVAAGYAPVPGAGWSVMAPMPLREIAAGAQAERRSTMLVFALGLTLSAAFAIAVSTMLGRTLRRIGRAAERLAAGDSRVRLVRAGRVVFREGRALERAFNAMAERIGEAQAEMARLARTDALTKLPSRGAFFEAAPGRLEALGAAGAGARLFFIDLDRFKAINDRHGHQVGDEVLRRFARRLEAAAQEGDLVARHAGDEFVLLRPLAAGGAEAAATDRLAAALQAEEAIGDLRLPVSASVGAADFPGDATELDALIARADCAMYRAKASGGSALARFDPEMARRAEDEAALRGALRRAIEEETLTTVFQPIVSIADGSVTAFEALARWTDPELGAVPPERFVRAAEESGLVAPLGRLVRRRAFAFEAAVRRLGLDAPVAVNAAQSELSEPDFLDGFLAELARAGLPGRAVRLELTESALHGPFERVGPALERLRTLGVALAIDDFGKGFWSHERLRRYPVDRLKVDLAFAGDPLEDAHARAVVESCVRLGRSLGLRVTVERVERPEHTALARRLGADEAQGILNYDALEEAEALRLVAALVGSRGARAGRAAV